MTRRSWSWDLSPWTDIEAAIKDVFQEITELGAIGMVAGFPDTEIRTMASGYQVVAAVPGMKRDALQLSVERGLLTLTGERERPVIADAKPVQAERTFGSFKKTIDLPDDADLGGIRARLADGYLTVDVPFRGAEAGRVPIAVEEV